MKGNIKMASPTRQFGIALIQRVVAHLREPLFWNGYALILSSMATSLLGLVYWGVAARAYNAEIVGTNTATMSGLQLLSLLAQLGMVNVANRFIPTAGKATAKLVLIAYAVAVTAALLAGLVFLSGITIWAPSLAFISSNPVLAMCFIGATMGWVIFVIQDAVLVGLRQATWVPIENIVFAVAKIALLIAFVSFIPDYGIFASWVIPSILIIIPTNILIFRYLIPRHVRDTAARTIEIKVGALFRFITGNYLSTLIWNSTVTIIPLLVFSRVGAETSAYFYLPWTIAFALHLVCTSLNMSFLTEVVSDNAKLSSYSFRTWSQTLLILIPAVIVIEVGAPFILQLFGNSYASGGATLLRLLTLSTIGYSFTAHFLEISRARQRNRDAFIVQAVLCFIILSLGYIFLGIWGITGLGIAWFIAHTAVGAYLAVTKLSYIWLPELKKGGSGRNIRFVSTLLWKWTHRRRNAEALRLAPQILADITGTEAMPQMRSWAKYTVIPTTSDMSVISVGPVDGPAEGIVKIPRSESAENSFLKQKHMLSLVREDARLVEFSNLLPVVLADGSTNGHLYSLEQMIPGVSAQYCANHHQGCLSTLAVAADAIRMLHIQTANTISVSPKMISHWVDQRIAVLDKLYEKPIPGFVSRSAIKRLQAELHSSFIDKNATVSWVHGDYWLGNIRVTPDGKTVTGILDWEQAAPDEIPQCDVLLLLVTTRMATTASEMGDVVTQLLSNPSWSAEEKAILDQAAKDFKFDPIDMRSLLLLTWLRHVSDEVAKTTHRATHWYWIYRNVEWVLRKL